MKVTLQLEANTNADLTVLAALLGQLNLNEPTSAVPSTSAQVMPTPAPYVAPVPQAAPAPEAPEEQPDAGSAQRNVDEWGVAWTKNIHSSSRKLYDNGKFHRGRGVHDSVYDALYVGKTRAAPAPAQPLPTAPTPIPPAPASVETPVNPMAALGTVPAAVVPPLTPPAGAIVPSVVMSSAAVATFPQFLQYLTQLTAPSRKPQPLPVALANAVLAEFGYKTPTELAAPSISNPGLIPGIAAMLEARDTGFQQTGQ